MDAVFLDMKKVFDHVCLKGFLHKVIQTETSICLAKLIYSFLIKVANHTSSVRVNETGVPQGSCLFSLLYGLYIDDFLTVFSFFVDDTMFYSSNKNPSFATIYLQ